MERPSWFLMMTMVIGLAFSTIPSCARDGKKKPLTVIRNCINDDDCGENQYCDRNFWQCKKAIKNNFWIIPDSYYYRSLL